MFTGQALGLWAVYSVILLLTAKPVGSYLYTVFTGGRTFLHPVLRPVEVGIYRLTGTDEGEEMSWYVYLLASLAISVFSLTRSTGPATARMGCRSGAERDQSAWSPGKPRTLRCQGQPTTVGDGLPCDRSRRP